VKKFLLYLLGFSIPLMVGFFLFESICRGNIAFSKKRDFIISHLESIETVAMGTSHIEMGIYSEGIPKIYNWGAAGQSFGYENALFKEYLPRMRNLRFALIEVSETRFLLDDEKDNWSNNVYWIHYDVPYNVNKWSPKSYFHTTQAFAFFRPIVIQACNPFAQKGIVDDEGFIKVNPGGRFEQFNFDTTLIRSTFKMIYDFKIDERVVNRNVEQLENTLELLKKYGIQPILIRPPFYNTFENGIPSNWTEQFENIIFEISQKFKVPYYKNIGDKVADVRCFYNDNHLNLTGAKQWTKAVEEVVSLESNQTIR